VRSQIKQASGDLELLSCYSTLYTAQSYSQTLTSDPLILCILCILISLTAGRHYDISYV